MPIASPIGFLDVVNATLRASQVESTSRLTVANTAATKNFSVGDKFHIDKDSVDPVSVTGNVVATGIKISNLTISPTFDLGAVSNVGNTTANTLQFANATTGFTTTANVEIGGNITLTSNAQVKVGSNVLTEYTGPHPREPKEMPIKKYPEIHFEDTKFDKNGTMYTQADYTVTVSSSAFEDSGFAPWKMFNGDNGISANNGWHTAGDPSSVSGSPYNTIDSSYTGEWVKLELPKAIKLSHISIAPRLDYENSQGPSKYRVYGSNNDSTWVQLIDADNVKYEPHTFERSGTVPSERGGKFSTSFSTTTDYYKYLALVVQGTAAPPGNFSCTIGEIQYYGREEPSETVGDLSLDTTLKSTFNSVRSNNYVMYFDGDEFIPGDNNSNNLVTGSSVSVVHHNATYDSTGKYWTLDGSTESNVTTGDLNLEGDVPHTVSMWVNASNLEANTLSQQLFSIGSGYDKALIRVDDTQIATNTWHNVTYAYQGEGGSKVTYVNGRKVEEETIDNTFGEYPPFSMTNYETGGYRVTTSNDYQSDASSPRPAYNAFSDSGAWMTEFDIYGRNAANNNNGALVTAGAPTIIDTSGTSHLGHYVTLETPFRFRASYLVISASVDSRRPENVVILGSNDGENWDLLYSNTSVPDDNDNTLYFNSTKGYKYHMFLVKNLDPNGEGALYIGRLRYFGDKEGDLTRFPEPTRALKYPTIVTKNGNGEVAVNFPTHTGAPYDSYAMRGHVIKASESIASYPAYAAFNGETHVALGTVWVGGYQQYGTGSGASAAGEYGGSRNLKTDLGTGGSATSNGSWLYIEMPHKIKVTSTKIVSYDTSPSTGHPPDYVVIYGTNDPSSSGGWNVVDNTYATNSSGIPNSQVGKTWAVSTASSPTAYKYFALVIVKTNGVSTYSHAIINDWQLIGTQEDIGTPAIVGGPFAGKVANFRVYDKYLGEERIQEIYDAQKDAFGHKKSSMTVYKGRIGVGTTEPECALTVLDEPHALEKFPARDITGNYSIIEDQGCFKISSSIRGGTASVLDDNHAWQAFNNSGASGHEWASIPPKGTRISEETDFGAWLKIETPESICLKKAEIKSNPHWIQVGPEIAGDSTSDQFGVAVACNHDGTRIMAAAPKINSVAGRVRVYDWDGAAWVQVGQNLTGANETGARFGHALAMSGDGNIIAIGAPFEHSNGGDAGTVRVYYLNGGQWTIVPDSGALTGVNAPYVDAFVGPATNDQLGQAVKLSYDGRTLAFNVTNEDEGGTDRGQVRIVKYVNGAWTNKGSAINGTIDSQQSGLAIDMSDDGDHIIIGGNDSYPNVRVYKWNAAGDSWDLKGSAFTHPSPNDDGFGQAVAISNDGNVVAIGIRNADVSDGAIKDNTGIVKMYHWSGSAWTLKDTLIYPHSSPNNDDDFGTTVNLSGDGKRLIVSSPWFDDSGDDNPGTAGKLWVYEYNNKNWILRRPNPRTSAPTSGGYISVSGTDSGGIGLVGNSDSVLGAGIENDRWTNLGLPDMGGQSIAISRDGSAILAGEWAYNSSSAGGDRGRIRVWNMPSNIKSIWGSNDNKNWTKITTAPTREEATSNVAGFQFGYNDFIDIKNINNSNYYKYHAIVADSFTRLRDVKLFGVRKQGSSTLHDGSLTLTKNLDVPRIGAPSDADDTPRRDKLLIEFNTTTNPSKESLDPDAAYKTGSIVRDTSGRGNHGLMVGSVYNIDQKALEFVNSPTGTSSAATSYLYRDDLGNQEDGNFHHSVSLWFKMKTGPSSVYRTIFEIGPHPRNNTQDIALYVTNDANNWLGFASGGNTLLGGGLASVAQEGRYYHIVIVYDGRRKYLYVDGKLSTSATYSSFNGAKNMTLQMARNNHGNANEGIDGCVSNFKMYINHALTPQEVRTLYGMGQCDEGHHNVNFSKTRVGIGLGDGEVSKALLDVRGSVCLGSPYGGSTVGIGTNLQESYPKDVPLHVYRHAPAANNKGGGIMLERYPGYGGAIWSEYNGTEDCLMFKTGQNTNDTYGADPQMVLTNTGQVGIGTSTPYRTLDVHAGARPSNYPFAIGGTWNNRANYVAKTHFPGVNIASYTVDFLIGGSERPGWLRACAGGSQSGSGQLGATCIAEFIISPYGTNFYASRRFGDASISVGSSGTHNGGRITVSHGATSYPRLWFEIYHEYGVYW